MNAVNADAVGVSRLLVPRVGIFGVVGLGWNANREIDRG